ncbi:MAG: hypothetical protein M3Q66_02420 [Chloroflexota bacterium]|nr:hypothetical protein [Chloroflexota bacterium]
MDDGFAEVRADTIRLELRLLAAEALRAASRDLGMDPPAIRWFTGTPPDGWASTRWSADERVQGFVPPTRPATVWIASALNRHFIPRIVAHEVKHAHQLEVLSDEDLGNAANESAARRFEREFARRNEWRW